MNYHCNNCTKHFNENYRLKCTIDELKEHSQKLADELEEWKKSAKHWRKYNCDRNKHDLETAKEEGTLAIKAEFCKDLQELISKHKV